MSQDVSFAVLRQCDAEEGPNGEIDSGRFEDGPFSYGKTFDEDKALSIDDLLSD